MLCQIGRPERHCPSATWRIHRWPLHWQDLWRRADLPAVQDMPSWAVAFWCMRRAQLFGLHHMHALRHHGIVPKFYPLLSGWRLRGGGGTDLPLLSSRICTAVETATHTPCLQFRSSASSATLHAMPTCTTRRGPAARMARTGCAAPRSSARKHPAHLATGNLPPALIHWVPNFAPSAPHASLVSACP